MARYPILVPLLLMLALVATRHAHAAGDDVANFEVALIVDGKKQSDTWINLSAGGTLIEIPASPIILALDPLLPKDVLADIERSVTSSGTLTNKTLSKFGVTISINGPKRQVFLGLTKKAAKAAAKEKPVPLAEPEPAEEEPADTVVAPKSPPAKVQGDSGPWTTTPMPALPGNVDAAAGGGPGKGPGNGGPGSAAPGDSGWEAGAKEGAPTGQTAAPQTSPALPKIGMEIYRLDRTRDELFEDVFKHKPPPIPPAVEVTLLVDGKSYGTLWINYNKELNRYTFPADPVLNALQGLVKRELWEKLARRAKTQSRFTVEDLIECGFPTVLNTSVFELSTGVPAQLLGTKIHPMTGQRFDPYSVPAYEPGWVAAYMNLRMLERIPYYQYNPTPLDSFGRGKQQVEDKNNEGRQPLVTNLDGAINLMSWVLEGRGVVWEKPTLNEFEVSRQDIRMVKDWPRQALRLTVGDLIFPTSGFQGFLKMGGVGFSRDFSLQPHLAAYPVKDFEFFLPNRSEVKVFINGALMATYQLEQGSHDLNSFPFSSGESEVEIQITDDTGQMQTLNFSFIHEPSLLAPGKSAFSYNVGFPSRDVWRNPSRSLEPGQLELLNYEYDTGHPLVFLEYKRGLSQHLTVEAYSQAMDTAGLVGINALQALKVGKVKADVAASYQANADPSWAGNVEYTYIPKANSNISPTSWRFRTEYLGSTFYRPGQDPILLGSLTIAGYYQKQGKIANISLGASYSNRFDSVDFYSGYLGVGKSFGKGWSTNFSLRNSFDRLRKTNTLVSATLSYYLFQSEHSINASERVENHVPDGSEKGTPPNWDYSTDIAWDYNGSAPFPSNPSLNATASFGQRSNDYTGRASWKIDQGIFDVSGRRFEPKASSVIINYADLDLKTSLVFVDGNFAMARPINNSFLMVKGVENEAACDILVNPSEMGYDAKGRNWLPGVVPNISPYSVKKIRMEVLDPPFGSNDERTDYTIYPGYKSGYVIYMGSEATIIALGTLLFSPGAPVQYQTFTATPLDGKTADPIMGFTNAAGKFQLTRLKPGRYRIDLEGEGKAYSLVMTLPKKTEGIKSLGTLILKPK
jgi:outer membrane usher protein